MNKKIQKKLHISKLGAALHDYRILKNLSLYELQEKTTIHRVLLYCFEHGRIEPTVLDIYQISKNMGISVEELYAYAESIPDATVYAHLLNDDLHRHHKEPYGDMTSHKKEEQMICFYLLSHTFPSHWNGDFNYQHTTHSPKH